MKLIHMIKNIKGSSETRSGKKGSLSSLLAQFKNGSEERRILQRRNEEDGREQRGGMEKVREHIISYGEVQGVGFRYRAKYLAQYLDITGFVRNQWDGSVEMEAQGREKDIEALVEELKFCLFFEG